MEIITSTQNQFEFNKKTCIALGNFDGVHLGHQKIIKEAVFHAGKFNLSSCVYTFDKHSTHILGNKKTLLNTNSEKESLIEKTEADYLYIESFETIRNMTPGDFCRNIIDKKLNASAVFCGENYRFGVKGCGNTSTLKSELSKLGISVFVIPFKEFKGSVISSTRIREEIKLGNITDANAMLGYYYTIEGCVTHGKKLGRTLGFPTLNIPFPADKTIPLFGVYISLCELNGRIYNSISNIGLRPTTDSDLPSSHTVNCETFLMDYTGAEAYGNQINVKLVDFLRPEMKFDSIDNLKNQINMDISSSEEYFLKNGVRE